MVVPVNYVKWVLKVGTSLVRLKLTDALGAGPGAVGASKHVVEERDDPADPAVHRVTCSSRVRHNPDNNDYRHKYADHLL